MVVISSHHSDRGRFLYFLVNISVLRMGRILVSMVCILPSLYSPSYSLANGINALKNILHLYDGRCSLSLASFSISFFRVKLDVQPSFVVS